MSFTFSSKSRGSVLLVSCLLFFSAGATAADPFAPTGPEYSADGNYTITYPWDDSSPNCDWFSLQERSVNSADWVNINDLDHDGLVEFVNKPIGVYEYRTYVECEDYYGDYSWEIISDSIEVTVGPTPTVDDEDTQLAYNYEYRIGDLNNDGLQDIYINRLTVADEGNGTIDQLVMLRQAAGGFDSVVPSSSQITELSAWPTVDVYANPVDLNFDGYVDLLLPDLSDVIPGVADQMVFAPGALYRYEPLGITAIDDNVAGFLDQYRSWLEDPSYFYDNAILVEEPGYWSFEVECDIFFWGDQPEIECELVPVWVDGDEYWSYDHLDQDALELAELFGFQTPNLVSAITDEEAGVIADIFKRIFGVVLGTGGDGGWGIEIGFGNDRGFNLNILIYDVAEETAPKDWRYLTLSEIAFLSLNGFDIRRVDKVTLRRKEYLPAKVAGFSNQVIAPNGHIYIPDGNISFGENLPWSEDYLLEDDWALMTVLHESFHVYQKKNKYRFPGLFKVKAINRDYAYDIEPGKDFWDYSLEQQATIIMERWYFGTTGTRTYYDPTVTMDELNSVIPFTCVICQ